MSARSRVMSARLSTLHATSSISIEVPRVRWAPTLGMSPLRMSQKTLESFGSTWNGNWSNAVGTQCAPRARSCSGSPVAAASCAVHASLTRQEVPELRSASLAASMRRSRCSMSEPRHSTRRPAEVGGQPTRPGVRRHMSSDFSASASAFRSKISTASTQHSSSMNVRRSAAVACPPWCMSGKRIKAERLYGCSTTVLKVTCDTKPRVPSEPTIMCLMISMGSSTGKSTSELIA
mmetsp:Transcript_55355/g.152411  ORF Transcript_55355/g.152411 Transcript_55355/m.152411 type:complete len:234 (+) Transcript_55355:2221-2922(+)